MKTADQWICELGLSPHPEGGYFRETYRSTDQIAADALPDRYGGPRSCATAIYFLLKSGDISALHRLTSDELWFFHAGCDLEVHLILPDCRHQMMLLGSSADQGQQLQITIPKGAWFGARPALADSFSLISCTVAPGFEFADFEMGEGQALEEQYPQHKNVINMLTR